MHHLARRAFDTSRRTAPVPNSMTNVCIWRHSLGLGIAYKWHIREIAPTVAIGLKSDPRNLAQTAALSGGLNGWTQHSGLGQEPQPEGPDVTRNVHRAFIIALARLRRALGRNGKVGSELALRRPVTARRKCARVPTFAPEQRQFCGSRTYDAPLLNFRKCQEATYLRMQATQFGGRTQVGTTSRPGRTKLERWPFFRE